MTTRSRRFDRISGVRNPDLIVIACEGEVTEQRYFNQVVEQCGVLGSQLKIEVLPKREGHQSSPKAVLAQMDAYRKEYGIKPSDDLCLVIDRDKQSWGDDAMAEVAKACGQKGYLLAVSNPCFELWLILHYDDLSQRSIDEQATLLANKNNLLKQQIGKLSHGVLPPFLPVEVFVRLTQQAIEHAQRLDQSPHERWPNGLATRVYLIMQKIMNSIQASLPHGAPQ